jgi:hypothetical protein
MSKTLVVGSIAVYLLISLGAATPLKAESTISCPSGYLDALDWLTLDADLRATKHMAGPNGFGIWTDVWPDKFWWMKTPNGDTCDIFLYDSQMIYLWITEESWNHPYNFKRNSRDTNFPAVPRCVRPGLPGSSIPISHTGYRIAINCVEGQEMFLGKAVMEWWGPYTAGNPGLEPGLRPPVGGQIPNDTPVYTLSYRWGCNNSYGNCSAKEEYVVAQRYGLVQYNFWNLVNGQYVLASTGNNNTVANGVTQPFFPCF